MDAQVTTWIESYRRAWESNEPADIRALFTEDAEYRTEPHAEPWIGHDAIIAGWLHLADDPGETQFEWSTIARDGDLAVIQAQTVYSGGPIYSNLWIITLAKDGRAVAFTEWWMDQAAHN